MDRIIDYALVLNFFANIHPATPHSAPPIPITKKSVGASTNSSARPVIPEDMAVTPTTERLTMAKTLPVI